MGDFTRFKYVRRALGAGLISGVVGIAGLATPSPAAAANPVTPGNFTGYGFDQCQAPSQTAMDRWWKHSNFGAVGIYIAGNSRGCRNQTNLSATWVRKQQARGWRLLPITLGPQASCNPHFPRYRDDPRISARSTDQYATAKRQGINQANATVDAAKRYGIAAGSTMFYDLEGFDIGNERCRESAMWFVSAWSHRIKKLGYRPGMYSSASSGIKAMYAVWHAQPRGFVYPADLWIADWDGRAGTSTKYIPDKPWNPHRRVKQYRGPHKETHGGVTIEIDSNFVDLGRGSSARPVTHCGGVPVSFTSYPALKPRTSSYTPSPIYTKALECMLRERGDFGGPIDGTYDAGLVRSINAWQRSHGLSVRKTWTQGAWKTLWAANSRPLLKRGSAGESVRDLQRALSATSAPERPKITGVMDWNTQVALVAYQKRLGRTANGMATEVTWYDLARGR
ncbi:glycoside hydrolase domain-containing protein [Nocardioides sp. NPDC058538]|uniref:glycoside hydrolase domain-containing protein n=1 Tax=Nocardioides sp. NPDC058538 TaxID=3346542 RepID=UPI0036683D84